MTNTVFIRPIYVDESSVEGSEILSTDENGGEGSGTMNGLEAKFAFLSVSRINCFGCSESAAAAEEEEEEEVNQDQEALLDNTNLIGELLAAGWPSWLAYNAPEAIQGWTPRRADTFEKLDKIGEGARSNVYKARDLVTGKIVALKKVRFDNSEPESLKFMARELIVLRRLLDHPNVIKLEGLVTSKMSCSLYLVFEYIEHDLSSLAANPDIKFTEPQVKCYMHQLLSGLDYCHSRGVLHSNINGSNLLLDKGGILKIAGFGSASFFDTNSRIPMPSRVVSLRYPAPEPMLGDY